jgi:nucleoside-diphosphate-sugar epimerase
MSTLLENKRIRINTGMVIRFLADAALVQIGLALGVAIRFYWLVAVQNPQLAVPHDLNKLFWRDLYGFLTASLPLTVICLVTFSLNGFYTYGKYYQGKYKALVVAQAISIAYLTFGFLWLFLSPQHHLPIARWAFFAAWGATLTILVSSRVWNELWKQVVHRETISLETFNPEERRILVVGGAGYIGSALLPLLLAKGGKIRVLDRLLYGEEPIANLIDHPNLEIIRGDFRHLENLVEAMHHVDAVVHLGAIVGDPACSLDEDLTIDVNLTATRMIAQLAKAAGVRRFIFASTCSVYGACDEKINERSYVKPISLYAHTKLASEEVLFEMADENFQPTVLRFATIYGLSGRTRFDLVVNVMAASAKIDGAINVFGGEQWRPFVHVEDAARSVALALESPLPLVGRQVFNVGSNNQNYTIRQIAEIVKEQVVSAELKVVSSEVDLRNYQVNFDKIHNHLGFEPIWTLESGIQQVLEAIASGEVDDYTLSRYSNVKYLSEEGTSQLTHNDWARRMIEELANQ